LTRSINSGAPAGGVRERKRRETLQRITEAGLKLFAANGYEATTLDAIAAEAGISRRTFFHYFRSKDDILLSLQSGQGESLVAALAREPATKRPLDAVRHAMMSIASSYSLEDLIAIDRFMLSSESVQARKQAGYMRDEAMLLAALRERWPSESDTSLRLVAMLSVNLTRLSLEAWRGEGGRRPIAELLDEAFDALEVLFGGNPTKGA
jgi:Transcriptional regulator